MLPCKVEESKPCPHQELESVKLNILPQLMFTCLSASGSASTVISPSLLWGRNQNCLVRKLPVYRAHAGGQATLAQHAKPQPIVQPLRFSTASAGVQQTIFFGGGTPSLVPPQALQRILAVLEQRFGIASDAEISMEADPGTFNVQVTGRRLHLPVGGQAQWGCRAPGPPG